MQFGVISKPLLFDQYSLCIGYSQHILSSLDVARGKNCRGSCFLRKKICPGEQFPMEKDSPRRAVSRRERFVEESCFPKREICRMKSWGGGSSFSRVCDHFTLIPFRERQILFFLQLWVNSRAIGALLVSKGISTVRLSRQKKNYFLIPLRCG